MFTVSKYRSEYCYYPHIYPAKVFGHWIVRYKKETWYCWNKLQAIYTAKHLLEWKM